MRWTKKNAFPKQGKSHKNPHKLLKYCSKILIMNERTWNTMRFKVRLFVTWILCNANDIYFMIMNIWHRYWFWYRFICKKHLNQTKMWAPKLNIIYWFDFSFSKKKEKYRKRYGSTISAKYIFNDQRNGAVALIVWKCYLCSAFVSHCQR